MHKQSLAITLLFSVSIVFTGCSGTGYWSDRSRDALDIVTLGVGMGVGAKAQLGPVQTGLLIEGDAFTLKGAELTSGDLNNNAEWQLVAVGKEQFVTTKLARNKNFSSGTTVDDSTIPFIHRLKCPDKSAYWYYTQLEAVLGLGPAVRFGLNPGEFVDFLLGWADVDIMKDDLLTGEPAKVGSEECPGSSEKRESVLGELRSPPPANTFGTHN